MVHPHAASLRSTSRLPVVVSVRVLAVHAQELLHDTSVRVAGATPARRNPTGLWFSGVVVRVVTQTAGGNEKRPIQDGGFWGVPFFARQRGAVGKCSFVQRVLSDCAVWSLSKTVVNPLGSQHCETSCCHVQTKVTGLVVLKIALLPPPDLHLFPIQRSPPPARRLGLPVECFRFSVRPARREVQERWGSEQGGVRRDNQVLRAVNWLILSL